MEKEKDLLLKMIHDHHKITLTEDSQRLLFQMLQESLIQEIGENSYRLTRYGETIAIMGYKIHKELEELEKELSTYTPEKTKKITRLISVVFTTLLLTLFVVLWIHFDFFSG